MRFLEFELHLVRRGVRELPINMLQVRLASEPEPF
jgi:hypothetical protein